MPYKCIHARKLPFVFLLFNSCVFPLFVPRFVFYLYQVVLNVFFSRLHIVVLLVLLIMSFDVLFSLFFCWYFFELDVC